MSKVTIEVNGAELDLAKGVGFGLNYSIDDVNKIDKKNSNYSKTITLAGSKNNNKILGGLFDVNADFTFFNPNFKTDAKIVIDSSTVMEGFLQLKAIEKQQDNYNDGNKIVYKCTITSVSSDFFSDIADKELNDLDFSRFSHQYTKDNIETSWGHTNTDVYTYPLLHKNSNTYQTKDFKPAIFHKAYLKRIAQEAGYTLGGSLLDESTDEGAAYAREIVPFNGDLPEIPAAEYERRKFRAGASTDNVLKSGTTDGSSNFAEPITDITFLDDDTTAPNFDPNGHWNTSLSKYTVDRNGTFQLIAGFETELTYTSKKSLTSITQAASSSLFLNFPTAHGITAGGGTITIQGTVNYDGVYTIVFVDATTLRVNGVTYVADEFVGTAGIDVSGDVGYRYNLYYRVRKNGSNFYYPTLRYLYGFPDLNSSNDWTYTYSYTNTLNYPNIPFLIGDEFTLQYFIQDTNLINALNEGVDYSIQVLNTSDTYIKNDSYASALTDDDTVSLNEYIPKDIKQSDIITDLVKRYNAYISIDPDNDRKIIIDTRDSYYEGGTVLDWTNKHDLSSKDDIKLLSELQNKEINFSYKADEDDYNKNYSESVDGDIYGEKKIEFINEFAKGTKKIETPFSPTPLIYNSGSPVAIVPAISTLEPKTNMRVLYFAGLIDCINSGSWNFEWLNSGTPTTTTYVQYPYAGHYDNPITPNIDLNFGNIPYAWYEEANNSTNGNLYNRFWSNYINQIDEGKLVKKSMNLTEVDINFIRHNLNSRIFIRDSYYTINKIVDYNPIELGLTTVEFLKIPDGISFVSDTPADDSIKSFKDSYGRASEDIDTLYKNTNYSVDSSVSGKDNIVLEGSNNALVVGDGNAISNDSPNAVIQGNNNFITNGIANAFIIGANGKTITQEGEGWIGDTKFTNGETTDKLINRIIVNQSNYETTICGVIDSTAEYFIDGIVDLGSSYIEVPDTGISIRGYSFDISGLISSHAPKYIMFKSPVNGSGNVLGVDFFITTSASDAKVFELTDANGFNAIEMNRVNYIDCASLGVLNGYRQGLESGTGRFGGSPSLTLEGTWLGGYRVTTSIVRNMSDVTTQPLFKKGSSFVMNSRFLTDLNVDLGKFQPLFDFEVANFPNPSTIQVRESIVTRQGVFVPNDTNITPNILASDLPCSWKGNNGINNTFVGGIATISTEVETVITASTNPTILLGTVTNTDMQHFDSPANGQLRHLGNNPREYTVNFDFVLEGGQGRDYAVQLIKNDGSDSQIYQQIRVVNNLQGGRDVAYFTGMANVILNKNEYLFWKVENLSNNANCTLELDSSWSVEER